MKFNFFFFFLQIFITFLFLYLINVGNRLTVLTPLIWHLTVRLSVRSGQWRQVVVTVVACVLPCNAAARSTASCKVQHPPTFVRFEFRQTWVQGFVNLHLLWCISIVFAFMESGMSQEDIPILSAYYMSH